MNTATQKAHIAATIKAVLEAPLPEPVEFEMTESAPVGTKGRRISVALPGGHGGHIDTTLAKTGTCRMYAKWRDPRRIFGSLFAEGEEKWQPVSSAFATVEALHNSKWYERASKSWNMDDFSEFRVARIR